MKPLQSCDQSILRNIKYVLCDLDDTLTLDGKLPASAYQALEDLKNSGRQVIVVTGRPAGWCDMIARMWPVTAVVGENGAFYFMYDQSSKTMVRTFQRDDEARIKDRDILFGLISRLREKYPHITLSADQDYRISDVAIDFCEDVSPWDFDEVKKVSNELADMGATVKISSIHINAWIGDFSKLEMARSLLATLGLTDKEMLAQCIYAGDSPNDEPMFEYFPHSVGVANVKEYVDSMTHLPAWVTEKPGGHGFSELTSLLIS